jgi:hypothetical protein
MLRSEPARQHGVFWAAVALVATLAAVAIVLAVRPWAPTTQVASDASSIEPDAVVAASAPISLPENPRVLVFGDSWTYGSASTPVTSGYAYVLGDLTGWDVTVDGVRGSGYLKPGIDGPTFGERIAALDPDLDPDLIILQGSINDRLLYPEMDYAAAVNAAWDSLVALYPDAQVLILGPAPHRLPVHEGTVAIDRDLATLAATRNWWYISPLREAWITDANFLDVIDTSEIAANHPSTAGHAYLADRLAADLERIVVVAAPVTAEG